MRYSVFNSRGKWQASYSHNIPLYSIKQIKGWAISTAKLCSGKVYETIVPKDKKYKPHDILLYDFTHLPNKLKDDYIKKDTDKNIDKNKRSKKK